MLFFNRQITVAFLELPSRLNISSDVTIKDGTGDHVSFEQTACTAQHLTRNMKVGTNGRPTTNLETPDLLLCLARHHCSCRTIDLASGAPPPLTLLSHLGHTKFPLLALNLFNILEADHGSVLSTLPRFRHDTVEFVDLLQRKAFRLVDHEPDEGDADEAETAPDLRRTLARIY